MTEVYLYLDRIPPSTNHLYVNARRGRFLSKQGAAFKLHAQLVIGLQLTQQKCSFPRDVPYHVVFILDLPSVENKNAGQMVPEKVDKKTGKVTPAHKVARYKVIDVSNRVKLVEDVLTMVMGVDDSHIHTLTVAKRQATKEGMHILVSYGEADLTAETVRSRLGKYVQESVNGSERDQAPDGGVQPLGTPSGVHKPRVPRIRGAKKK